MADEAVVIVPMSDNMPEEVAGVDTYEAVRATELHINLFFTLGQALGPAVALSALVTAGVNMGVRLMEHDDLRQTLQTTIDRLPDLYAEKERRDRDWLEKLN